MTSTVPISVRVVQGVAAHEGTDPTALEPPLHSVIDTDALDALFRPVDDGDEPAATITFSYRGKEVRVDSTGRVDVTAGDAGRNESAETGLEP